MFETGGGGGGWGVRGGERGLSEPPETPLDPTLCYSDSLSYILHRRVVKSFSSGISNKHFKLH